MSYKMVTRVVESKAIWNIDPVPNWSEYADAVVHAIGDRAEVILVAASMGVFTAPIVCTRHRVDLLVLLNAMIPMPGETFNAWGSNTADADRAEAP